MYTPDRHTPHSAISPLDPLPDYHLYRERAHRERTRAINRALSMAWNRLAGRTSRQKSDAAFWTA
ncbi:hypothetical protein [Hoeflea alexandrii]|uniref:hypothetical protein n=1 Tax=Hoeflea alexandrii TaxID=288436 RepID=UPI0022AF0093|nr:hypothetical protein [Hoeflea alexandrii]MCZ4288231.1 hypothetical protein [Hoeflea alexandrii]